MSISNIVRVSGDFREVTSQCFRLIIFSVTVFRHMKVYMLWDNSKKYGGFSIMEVTSQSSEFKYFRFLLNLNTQKYIF